MAKARRKKPKGKAAPAASTPSAGEQLAAAKRQVRQLRELRGVMRQVSALLLRVEEDAVATARVLLAPTECVVMFERDVRQLEHALADTRGELAKAYTDLDVAKRELNADPV